MGEFKVYWRTWLWRDVVTKIISINTLVWCVVGVCWLINERAEGVIVSLLALPSSLRSLALRPWTPLTYMFVQADFMHLLVNMLCFMPFAMLMRDLQGGVRTCTLYIYGGLASALVFLAMGAMGMGYTMLLGASCSVLAIIGAVMVLYPHFRMGLLFFGPVKVLWVALGAVVLFAIGWPDVLTAMSHGAGLLTGVVYGLAKNRGIDLARPIIDAYERLGQKHVYKAQPQRQGWRPSSSDEQEMDRLLDKVSRSGYSSLTPAERQRLFDLTQRKK